MKKLIFAILPIFFFSCCKDPEPPVNENCKGVLTLNFKPTFNGKPFVINAINTVNGKKVRFTKLHFYASSIFTATDQVQCPTNDEAVFVNLTQLDDSAKSLKGFDAILYNRLPGTFNSITLGLGLNSNLNGKKPSDFPSSNLLSNTDEYWDSWKSYIFFKLEGLMDKDDNGSFETGITYHTGANEAFSSVSLNKTYTYDERGGQLNFNIAVEKIISGFDFNVLNKIENLSQKEDMKKIMTNLGSAISVGN